MKGRSPQQRCARFEKTPLHNCQQLLCLAHICRVSELLTMMSTAYITQDGKKLRQKFSASPTGARCQVKNIAVAHFLEPDVVGCNYDARSIVVDFSATSRHLLVWPDVGRVNQRFPRFKNEKDEKPRNPFRSFSAVARSVRAVLLQLKRSYITLHVRTRIP